ncbi:MAG TPA: CoA pyrophosphatase [Pseudonocardiaceae bacterium]|jgi:8-oxo-dGTP pyrophosphatase MutT (NUDIX family)|nr:CoA pyrophosphatase [Pseudonocardiaceae bacterium]
MTEPITPGPLVDVATVPDWLASLVTATASLDPTAFRRAVGPPRTGARLAAVLMLFGDGTAETGPDLLLLRRADTLGKHAGQVAFPGGSADPDDDGPVGTALREAVEEVGLRPDGVRPLALLPRLYVPVSGFDVTPVLAHWQQPSPVRAVDPGETAAVARVPISLLTDPAHRLVVRHPSGVNSPAYLVPGMLVWGFTAALVTMCLQLGGWDRPWDRTDVRDIDNAWAAAIELGPPPPVSGTWPAAHRPHDSTGTVRPVSADEEAS